MNKSIPPLLLEQAALGELSATELQSHRERFGPDFDNAVQRLKEQNEAWSERPTSERELQQIRARIGGVVRPNPRRRWIALSALTCACAALFVVLRSDRGERASMAQRQENLSESPSFRLKGLSPYLTLHRKVDSGQEELTSGRHARQGDLIQLSYVAAGASYGAIVSVDGRGHTTLHFPTQINADPSLESGGAIPLEQAYELDDAPHFERFFFVTVRGKEVPKDFVQQVLGACKTLAQGEGSKLEVQALALPASWLQADFLLKKEERPS